MANILTRALSTLRPATTPEGKKRLRLQREWDRQRSRALSDRDRAEIDAIFTRGI
jgi:hypothetical protein